MECGGELRRALHEVGVGVSRRRATGDGSEEEEASLALKGVWLLRVTDLEEHDDAVDDELFDVEDDAVDPGENRDQVGGFGRGRLATGRFGFACEAKRDRVPEETCCWRQRGCKGKGVGTRCTWKLAFLAF